MKKVLIKKVKEKYREKDKEKRINILFFFIVQIWGIERALKC